MKRWQHNSSHVFVYLLSV